MTLTNYPDTAETIRQFVNWGRACRCKPGDDDLCGKRFESVVDGIPWDHKYQFDTAGGNFKPGLDIQGRLGTLQLGKAERYGAIRKRNHGIVTAALRPLEDIVQLAVQLPGSDPSWFGCAVTLKRGSRQEVIKRIEGRGVASRLLFGGNISRQRFLEGRYLAPFGLDQADKVMRDTFVVGCNHTISLEEAHYIAEVVSEEVSR